ncbi:hypothetical protein EIG84_01300 [Flavobacteriaceae bacterium 14752]|nr:hypothetical protein EIG84_01300 [Flavobacteriaceae bacterium 14752]
MKVQFRLFIMAVISIFMASCSDDDVQNSVLNIADVEGSWTLSEINSTPVVDLENNGNTDANLMNQTSCFDGMSLDFDTSGNLTVVTSEITFDANTNPSFSCSLRTDSGSYIISGNDLTVTIPVSGSQETETIVVNVQNNMLSFSLTQNGIAQFFNVPSGESFSAINELEFVYLKN